MTPEQLEDFLWTLADLEPVGSLTTQKDKIGKILMHFQELYNLAEAVEEVLRCGTSERYFDGRAEGNAPAHRHKIPGQWDYTNHTCEWCHAWTRMRKRVERCRR